VVTEEVCVYIYLLLSCMYVMIHVHKYIHINRTCAGGRALQCVGVGPVMS